MAAYQLVSYRIAEDSPSTQNQNLTRWQIRVLSEVAINECSEGIRLILETAMLDDINSRWRALTLSLESSLPSAWIMRDKRIAHRNNVRRTTPTFLNRVRDCSRVRSREDPYTLRVRVAESVNGLIVVPDYGQVRGSREGINKSLIGFVQILKLVNQNNLERRKHVNIWIRLNKTKRQRHKFAD